MGLIMIIIVVALMGAAGFIGYAAGRSRGLEDRRRLQKELAAHKWGVRGLRAIANGVGRPELEAQLTLDQVERKLE